MASFPATLPAPLIGNFNETPPDLVVRTKMDAGVDKVRRRFSAGATNIKFSIKLTEAQVAILDTFFVATTNGGADEFTYKHPRTKSNVTARFKSPPSYSDIDGRNYNVGLEIEILP